MSQPSPSQRDEYRKLFDTLEIRSERAKTIDKLCASALALVPRYTIVSARTGVPWYFLAAVHLRESTFKIAHLHNGDPLSARTVHVPAGLPKTPEPPYTFEQSAEDALRQKDLHQWTDWGLTGTLYQLESYNGMGYRKRGKPSPYLWSFSHHYQYGKFIADGNTRPGGKLPLNTNGGGILYTHTGMYGMFAIQESVRQLRGEAYRQVDGVKTSVVQGVGGMFTAAATLVLSNQEP